MHNSGKFGVLVAFLKIFYKSSEIERLDSLGTKTVCVRSAGIDSNTKDRPPNLDGYKLHCL